MIISHEHRFIFVKTRKTAGTSIEVFLTRHLGAGDVVTPVNPPVSGHEPRNYERRFNPIPQIVHTRAFEPAWREYRRRRAFYNHIAAARIRERVGATVWRSYFKFCFERDPWEKVVSWYYFRRPKLDPGMSFHDFVLSAPLPTDFDLYSIGGNVAMDFVGLYERLTTDLTTALAHVGIDTPVDLSSEKAGIRPRDAGATALFTPELDARIATVFRREIEHFGYPDRSQADRP